MNDNKTYCIFCGTENKIEDNRCKKCHKKLEQKSHPFRDFLYRHIKDEIKDKVSDNLFSLIKGFITSHLYGATMVVTILFTTATTALNVTSNNDAKGVISVKSISALSSENLEEPEETPVVEEVKVVNEEIKLHLQEMNVK